MKNKLAMLKEVWALFVIILILPSEAQAVQIHGPPEGFVVHIMGHIFFSIALLFLIYILHKYPLDNRPAWKYLKISIFFWLIWNLDTLMVHILSFRLPKEAIATGSHMIHSKLKGPFDLERLLLYFGKFDHLLCVPAMYCLAMSLKDFCKTVERHQQTVGSNEHVI